MGKRKRRERQTRISKSWLAWLIYGCALLAVATPLLAPFGPLVNYTQIKTFTYQTLVELMFVAWVVLAVADKRYRPRWNVVSVALLVFTAATLLTLPFSEDPSLSFWHISNRMTGVVTWLHHVAWFFVLSSSLHSRTEWVKLFKTSGLICYAALVAVLVRWSDDVDKFSLTNIFGNSFYTVSYVMPHVFVGLYFWLTEKSAKKYFWLSLSVVASLTIFLTGSRSGILAILISLFAAAVGLALVSDKSRSQKAVIISVSSLLLLVAVGGFFGIRTEAGRNWVANNNVPGVLNRLAHRDFGGDRLALWDMALQGIAERPIFGWGNLQFLLVSTKYLDIDSGVLDVLNESWMDSSHNQYLDHLVHYGIVGFAAYLLLWVAVLVLLLRTYFRLDSLSDKRGLLLAGILFANYLMYTIFIFDTPQQLMILTMVFAGLSQVWFANRNIAADEDESAKQPSVVLFVILLIPASVFGWYANGEHYLAQGHFVRGAAAVKAGAWPAAAEEFNAAYQNEKNPYVYELRTFAMEPMRNSIDYYFTGSVENEDGLDQYLYATANGTAANVEDHPTNPKALFLAADTHRYLYKVDETAWQKSYDYVQRSLEQSPDRFDAHLQMAELMVIKENYDEAHKWFDSAYERHFKIARQFGGFILYRKSCVYARQRDFTALAETISESAKMFPGYKDARLILILGDVVQDGDNLSGFEPFLDLAATHFQRDVEVLIAAARIYHVMGYDDMVHQVFEVPAVVEWRNSEAGREEFEALKQELNYIEW